MPVTKNVDAIMKILESSKDKEELDKTFDALRERIHELSEKMKKSEKKPEQKKPEQKKPDQKKSEKKPDQKKPEKKPEQKKPDQKKPKKTDTSTKVTKKGTTSLEDEPNYRNVTKITMIRAIRNNTKSNKDEYIKKLEKIGENAKKPLLYKLVKDAGLIKESIKK